MDWWQIEVPRPPSVNRFVKHLGNRSPAVQHWQNQADRVLLTRKPYPRHAGLYELRLEFPVQEAGKYDLDNRIKATSDWLQSREVVQDDRNCMVLILAWAAQIPLRQCRIMVREWSG